MSNDPMFNRPRLTLRSVNLTGMMPEKGEEKGYANYSAAFEVHIDGIELSIPINTSTPDGWASAATLACERLKDFAAKLAELAEKEKTGPHPFKLY